MVDFDLEALMSNVGNAHRLRYSLATPVARQEARHFARHFPHQGIRSGSLAVEPRCYKVSLKLKGQTGHARNDEHAVCSSNAVVIATRGRWSDTLMTEQLVRATQNSLFALLVQRLQ